MLVVAIVLLSSAGLLAAGLVSLWHSARAAEVAAAAASERAAGTAARALRASLRDPAQLRAVAPERTFRVEGGRLVAPPGFPWLVTPPPEDPELELPIALLAQVRAAEASSRSGDGPGSAGAFTEALAGAQALPTKQARWVELAAAWSAQRRGEVAERDRLLDALLAEPDAPSYRSATAGLLLLAAKARRELTEQAWRAALAGLEPATVDALLAQLERESDGLDLAPIRATAAALAATRRVLAAVAPLVPRLLAARAPLLEAAGEELLLWCPDADPSAGGGALLPPRELLGEGADAGGGSFVFGPVAPADALPVVPLVAIVPGAPPAAGALAGSRGLATLIVVLAATFGGGLFVALRMVRREVELTGARARFLTNVTHELKTPLASIRLFSEMLLDGRVESEAKRDEYHRLLAGESERLSALIENVLDLGRLERGERALDLAPRRLDELAREVVERFAPLSARDGVAIATRGLDVPCAAVCDRGAFAQALVNLLDNARKYAASGGRIEVALERAPDAGGGQGRDLVRVCVRDFGPGIPEEERARIFEPFVRSERQRDGSIAGLGLGLHLARTLTRAQGGELACEAPEGGGARFVLTLPAADAADTASNGAATTPATPSPTLGPAP